MNKLVMFALLGAALIVLAAATNQEEESSLQSSESEVLQREAREADPEAEKRTKKGKKSPKNKRKSRKNKSIKKKSNKQQKKKGQGKKKSRKNKSRKSKGKGKKNNTGGKRKSSSRTIRCSAATCIDDAISAMKLLKDKVFNFENQWKRIQKRNSTAGKKMDKKGDFKKDGQSLISNGGGNASDLACGTNKTNAGAKQLKNLTETLQECETNIFKACSPSNLPLPNKTEVDSCNAAITTFKNWTDGCIKLTGASACACWSNTSSTANATQVIKKCDLSGTNKLVVKAVKNCTEAFGLCRKYQDDTASTIQTCGVNPQAVKQKLKNLSLNQAATKKASAKVKALASSTTRAFTTCGDFIIAADKLSEMIKANPQDFKISAIAEEISNSSVTCSTAEKASLQEIDAALDEGLEDFEESIQEAFKQIKDLIGEDVTVASLEAFLVGVEPCTDDDGCPGPNPFEETTSAPSSTAGPTTAGSPTADSPTAGPTTKGARNRRNLFVQQMLARSKRN